jgi:putative MFS transporter
MQDIEREASGGKPLPPPAPAPAVAPSTSLASLLTPALLPRLIVGSIVLVVTNTLIFGFVTSMPTFFVQQGRTLGSSLGLNMLISLGSLPGCLIGAWGADYWGRKPTIIAASALAIVGGALYSLATEPAGLCLIGPIYILTAILYGVYTAEIFPTEVRLRANGICNFFGRGATVVSPFIVFGLFKDYGVQGVLWLMVGLLAVQILVVAIWGVETRRRTLEEVAAAPVPA